MQRGFGENRTVLLLIEPEGRPGALPKTKL